MLLTWTWSWFRHSAHIQAFKCVSALFFFKVVIAHHVGRIISRLLNLKVPLILKQLESAFKVFLYSQ